jgi:hypothetical protein
MRTIGEIVFGIVSGVAAWFISESIGYYVFGANALQISTTIIYTIISLSVALVFVVLKKWIALGVYIVVVIFTYPPVVLLLLGVIGCAIGQCPIL